jgi:hypothetical protein
MSWGSEGVGTAEFLLLCCHMRACSVGVVAVAVIFGAGHGVPQHAGLLAGEPRLVLWAWERPERLGFIDTQRVAVAFLAETLLLKGDTVIVIPRRQPLVVPKGTQLTAVVRIETRWSQPASLSAQQRTATVDRLVGARERTGVSALQIDFDASRSEREFYRALLSQLRERLPADCRLSITALASWCLDDPWIATLPIDEAVPMLFRMGPDGPAIRRRFAATRAVSLEVCRRDLGLSMDEGWMHSAGVRYWIFNPRAWSEESAREAARRVGEEGPL